MSWTKVSHEVPSDIIPQSDGPIDILGDDVPGPGLVRQRVSDYTFNHEKQSRAIEDDAILPDYEVTLNNFEENCNIKCSPGFYVQVARPCFSSLNNYLLFHLACGIVMYTPDCVNF